MEQPVSRLKNSVSVYYFSPFFSVSGVRREITIGQIDEMTSGQLHTPLLNTMIVAIVAKTPRGYRLLNRGDARLMGLLSEFDSKTRVEVLEVNESAGELERIEYLAGQVFPQITSSIAAKDFLSTLAASHQKQKWTAEAFGLQPQRKNTGATITVAGLTDLLGRNGPSHVTVGNALNGKQKPSKAKPTPPPPPREINILVDDAEDSMMIGSLDQLSQPVMEPTTHSPSQENRVPNLTFNTPNDEEWAKAAKNWDKYREFNQQAPSFNEIVNALSAIQTEASDKFISKCNNSFPNDEYDLFGDFAKAVIDYINKNLRNE